MQYARPAKIQRRGKYTTKVYSCAYQLKNVLAKNIHLLSDKTTLLNLSVLKQKK